MNIHEREMIFDLKTRLEDEIDCAEEDYANLDWINKVHVMRIISDVFDKFLEQIPLTNPELDSVSRPDEDNSPQRGANETDAAPAEISLVGDSERRPADTHSPTEQTKPEPVAKGASNAMYERERSFIRDKPAPEGIRLNHLCPLCGGYIHLNDDNCRYQHKIYHTRCLIRNKLELIRKL